MTDKQFEMLAKLKLDVAEFNKGAQEAKKTSNSLKSAVEQVSKDIKGSYANIAGGVSLVKDGMEGLSALFEGVNSVIESNMTLSDQWEKQTIGIGNAWDSVKNSISNLDFSNLIENIKIAYDAGVKYAEILDLLEDKQRGHNIAVAESGVKLAQLKIIYQDVTKSEKERKSALEEAKKIETDLAKQDTANKKQRFEATKTEIINTKKLSEAELMNFVAFKNGYEDKVALAEEYNNKVNEYNNLMTSGNGTSGGTVNVTINNSYSKELDARRLALKKEINATDAETINLAKVLNLIGDKQVKKLEEEYIAYQNATAAEVENIATLDKRYNMMDLRQQKAVGNIEKLSDSEVKFSRQTEKDLERIDALWTGMFMAEGYKTNAPSMWDNGPDVRSKMDANIQNMMDQENPYWQKQIDDILAYNEAVNELIGTNILLSESFDRVAEKDGKVTATMIAMAGSMQDAAINGATSMKELANVAIETARKIISAEIAKGVAGAVSSALKDTPFPINLIAGPVAGAAAATMFNSLIPKFESGGIVPGSSFYGDKVPVLANSGEMFINQTQQAKLFRMLNTGQTDSLGGGEVRFEIEGNKLVGVLNNYNRRVNSFR